MRSQPAYPRTFLPQDDRRLKVFAAAWNPAASDNASYHHRCQISGPRNKVLTPGHAAGGVKVGCSYYDWRRFGWYFTEGDADLNCNRSNERETTESETLPCLRASSGSVHHRGRRGVRRPARCGTRGEPRGAKSDSQPPSRHWKERHFMTAEATPYMSYHRHAHYMFCTASTVTTAA